MIGQQIEKNYDVIFYLTTLGLLFIGAFSFSQYAFSQPSSQNTGNMTTTPPTALACEALEPEGFRQEQKFAAREPYCVNENPTPNPCVEGHALILDPGDSEAKCKSYPRPLGAEQGGTAGEDVVDPLDNITDEPELLLPAENGQFANFSSYNTLVSEEGILTFRSDRMGFEMNIPVGWALINTTTPNYVRFYADPYDSVPWFTLWMVPSNGTSVEQAAEAISDLIGPEWPTAFWTKYNLSGMPGINFIKDYSAAAHDEPFASEASSYYVVVSGEDAYIFDFRAQANEFFRYWPSVTYMLNSFRILS